MTRSSKAWWTLRSRFSTGGLPFAAANISIVSRAASISRTSLSRPNTLTWLFINWRKNALRPTIWLIWGDARHFFTCYTMRPLFKPCHLFMTLHLVKRSKWKPTKTCCRCSNRTSWTWAQRIESTFWCISKRKWLAPTRTTKRRNLSRKGWVLELKFKFNKPNSRHLATWWWTNWEKPCSRRYWTISRESRSTLSKKNN